MNTTEISTNSCLDYEACDEAVESNIGFRSCIREYAYNDAEYMTIGDYSCVGYDACEYSQ